MGSGFANPWKGLRSFLADSTTIFVVNDMEEDSTQQPESYGLSREVIDAELLDCLEGARTPFKEEFSGELVELTEAVWSAFQSLRDFTRSVSPDQRAVWVEVLLLYAFNSLLTSSHLLISGLLIPSGNLMRQYGEAAATALLTSHPLIDTLDVLEADPTKVNFRGSINKVKKTRYHELLDVTPEGWKKFSEITKWYDRYSHVSALGVSAQTMLEGSGAVVIGAEFDPSKRDGYQKELTLRISAASTLTEIAVACGIHVTKAQSSVEA